MSSLRKQYEVSEGALALPWLCLCGALRALSPLCAVLRCRQPCREPTCWNPCWSSSGSWRQSDRPVGLGSGSPFPLPFFSTAWSQCLGAFRCLGVLF